MFTEKCMKAVLEFNLFIYVMVVLFAMHTFNEWFANSALGLSEITYAR